MSNVSECIDLYLTDDVITDKMFRAIMLDAHARDLVERASGDDPLDDIRSQLEAHSHALVLLNQVDDVRADAIDIMRQRIDALVTVSERLAERFTTTRENI